MVHLTSQQALQLAADFAITAERLRAETAPDFQNRANFYESACRVAFLRADVIARNEDTRPAFGQAFRRTAFATA